MRSRAESPWLASGMTFSAPTACRSTFSLFGLPAAPIEARRCRSGQVLLGPGSGWSTRSPLLFFDDLQGELVQLVDELAQPSRVVEPGAVVG